MLYLQLGPIQIFIYSLNFVVDVNDFTFVRSLFHTLGPRALGPFIAVSSSIMKSDYDIMWPYFCGVFFRVKIFFIYEGLILF